MMSGQRTRLSGDGYGLRSLHAAKELDSHGKIRLTSLSMQQKKLDCQGTDEAYVLSMQQKKWTVKRKKDWAVNEVRLFNIWIGQ